MQQQIRSRCLAFLRFIHALFRSFHHIWKYCKIVPTFLFGVENSSLVRVCPTLFNKQHTCTQLLVLFILIITLVALVDSGRHGLTLCHGTLFILMFQEAWNVLEYYRIFKSGYMPYLHWPAFRWVQHVQN